MERLVISPCCNPELDLDEALAAYSKLGFRKFEVFTSWVRSAFDIEQDPGFYLAKGRQYGMRFTSLHLPAINEDLENSLAQAIRAARFAAAIGAKVVLFKANTRAQYVKAAKRFLDAVEPLAVTAVLQNHHGTAISTTEDFREVIDGIHDRRMKTLLEVGHFHSAGVHWMDGYKLLGPSIALVHIKDQIGRQSVPFGTGEIDLPGLFAQLNSVGYRGDFVVEMEVQDPANTLEYLADAREYLRKYCLES